MTDFYRLPRTSFRTPRATRGGYPRAFFREEETPLTGVVQKQKAGQAEERISRTLDKAVNKKNVFKYYFRWTTLKRGTPGYKELDFFILTPARAVALSVKGMDFVHKSSAQKEKDKLNEALILKQLNSLGYNVREVVSITAEDIKTQKDADEAMRKIGVYR